MSVAPGDPGRSYDTLKAFAFAAADLLIEADRGGLITSAEGAGLALIGRMARTLGGTPVRRLVHPGDHDVLDDVLARIGRGERVRNVGLRGLHGDGRAVDLLVSGAPIPARSGAVALAFGVRGGLPAEDRRGGAGGVLDQDGFTALASKMAAHADPGDPYRLTLVEVPELPAVTGEEGVARSEAFASALGQRLRALSVGGDAVGRLDASRYGLVHAAAVSPEAIGRTVVQAARAVLPDGPAIAPSLASLVLDVAGIPPDQVTSALAYTLNRFVRDGGGLAGLTADLQPRLSATVRQMADLHDIVATGSFDLLFQPIVDLWTNVVHHFECLVRFRGNESQSPYQLISFAEDVGMVGMLDLSLLGRAITMMRSPVAASPSLRFAVNLSGRTLSDPAMVRRLVETLAGADDLRKRLVFEMTESAEILDLGAVNEAIQSIRQMGHAVCLDDFGAGNAAFHYLRALKVDNVKIDGSYIRDAMRNRESVAFIKAIVQLCGDLNITTTAEFVEDAETANLLRLLKVRYGQGWYFGKPRRPEGGSVEAAWKMSSLEWRNGLLYFKS